MKSTSFLALLVTSLVASVFGFVPKTFSARSKGSTLSMSASERTYIMVRRRTNYPGINTQKQAWPLAIHLRCLSSVTDEFFLSLP